MIVHCLQIDWVLCPAFLPFRCHQVWNPIKPPRGIPDLISRFRGSSVVKVLRLRLEPAHSTPFLPHEHLCRNVVCIVWGTAEQNAAGGRWWPSIAAVWP